MSNVGKTANLSQKIMHAASIEFKALLDVLENGWPDVMLQFGGGIGDELLLTAVARELRKRKPDLKIWQVSHSSALLQNNPDYARIFTMDHWQLRYAFFLGKKRCRLSYAVENKPREAESPPDIHIIAELCRKAGIKGSVSIRPYIFLTEDEKKAGRLAPRQIAVQCIGHNSYVTIMRNKLWYADRFQEVVENLLLQEGDELQIVQIGTEEDALLQGVIDLRGKTSFREAAGILSQSECFIGTVGFLMHLARAVECRSVIIYGGREHSSQTGYICNENLNSYINCAPCWLWDKCNYDNNCMRSIKANDVVNAYRQLRKRKIRPLETEVISL